MTWLELAMQKGKSYAFERGKTIFEEGSPETALWVVTAGWVKLVVKRSKHENVAFGLRRAGDLLNPEVFFGFQTKTRYAAMPLGSECRAAALTDNDFVSAIPIPAVKTELTPEQLKIIAGSLDLSHKFVIAAVAQMCRDAAELERLYARRVRFDLRQRVALCLLDLREKIGLKVEDGWGIAKIGHKDIAELVGGVRERVTFVLNDFEREKFINKKRGAQQIVLKDLVGLAEVTGHSDYQKRALLATRPDIN